MPRCGLRSILSDNFFMLLGCSDIKEEILEQLIQNPNVDNLSEIPDEDVYEDMYDDVGASSHDNSVLSDNVPECSDETLNQDLYVILTLMMYILSKFLVLQL